MKDMFSFMAEVTDICCSCLETHAIAHVLMYRPTHAQIDSDEQKMGHASRFYLPHTTLVRHCFVFEGKHHILSCLHFLIGDYSSLFFPSYFSFSSPSSDSFIDICRLIKEFYIINF